MVIANAVAATLLAGSVGGLASPPSGDAAAYEKQARLEVERVACMTERGLDYVASPEPRHTWQPGERERLAGDPEALRAYRAKYGFGVWSTNVYAKDEAVIFLPNLKPAQARPYLDKEIKAALKDLECGKDFYPAYSPKAMEITSRVYQEFGQESAAQAIPSRIYRKIV